MKYPIVKPYLPELTAYQAEVANIFDRCWLTNNGQCLQQLEQALAEYFAVDYLVLVANGTLALEVAIAALDVKGPVLTTPFSFAATASALSFQKITPYFIDVDPESYNLSLAHITTEQAQQADAILAVHVFGNPCEVDALADFATQHHLKVIYDAAHAFGSNFNGQSVLCHGDAATLSLHATKLFHTVEGGAIIFKEKAAYLKAKQLINFGFNGAQFPEYVGTNAKMSEMHAAMGLSLLPKLDFILQKRKLLVDAYQKGLAPLVTQGLITLQLWHPDGQNNGAYMPVLLPSEAHLLAVMPLLTQAGIQTRRYFYPSLSQVPAYGMQGETPIANGISAKILALPIYTDLSCEGVAEICQIFSSALERVDEQLKQQKQLAQQERGV